MMGAVPLGLPGSEMLPIGRRVQPDCARLGCNQAKSVITLSAALKKGITFNGCVLKREGGASELEARRWCRDEKVQSVGFGKGQRSGKG